MQCVLADGTIATVTADGKYSDLYWALQGGGNSFALVTRFDLQTFPLETALRAEASYVETKETKDLYLNALLNFTLYGDEDTHAALTPVIRWGPNYTVPSYETTIFYNGSVAPASGPVAAFYDGTIESINSSSTLHPMSLAAYSRLLRPAFEAGGPSHGLRQRFRVVPIKATRKAMDIVHDIWFSALQTSNIANRVPGFFAGLAYNAVTRTFAERSQGTPMDVSIEPQFWVEEAISWNNAADDVEIEKLLLDVNTEIEHKLSEEDLGIAYVYLNDADKGQLVFENYGEENLKKLKQIRDKYDPKRVFTDLMPGGFKVAHAKSGCD